MITDENRHEVTMLLATGLGAASKFSALSLAHDGIEDEDSRRLIGGLLRSYQTDVDINFNRLATVLGYTVKAEEVTK